MQDTANLSQHKFGFPSPVSIAFSWLLILRWGAVICQALLILIVFFFFDISIPFVIVGALIIFQAISNGFFIFHQKRRSINAMFLPSVMFMDVILLTLLLYHTGGVMNPFTFLYLVHVVLGAILMRPKWSWALAFFTVLCYASFFFPERWSALGINTLSSKVEQICHEIPGGKILSESHMKIHLQGMWVAFSMTVCFIVFFVGRIQKALEDHQRVIVNLEEEKVKSEKLASLATLAAGAAHEFSTPLSTIAVASGEMIHVMENKETEPQFLEDVTLIREQVGKCKEIIFQMAADAGEHLGELLDEFSVKQLIEDVLVAFFSEMPKREILVNNDANDTLIKVPYHTFIRTMKGLLKNASDADQSLRPIVFSCRIDSDFIYFEIEDKGVGMDPDTLAKACEPFFTKKNVGQGLGLGLYLAKSLAERLGGDLYLYSEVENGTKAIFSMSLNNIVPE